MDKEKERAIDIFGEEIYPGKIVMFVSSSVGFDIAVVEAVKWGKTGNLVGYVVKYPDQPPRTDWPRTKKKFIAARRELACVPAGKLSKLASSQARMVHAFVERLLYIKDRIDG